MAELSQRVQDLVVILATSLWAGRQASEIVQDAADILCQDLTPQAHRQAGPTDAYFRAVTKLGEAIADGGLRGHRRHRGRADPDAVHGVSAIRATRWRKVARMAGWAVEEPLHPNPPTHRNRWAERTLRTMESSCQTHSKSKSWTAGSPWSRFDLPDKKVNTLSPGRPRASWRGWSASWRKRTDLRGSAASGAASPASSSPGPT